MKPCCTSGLADVFTEEVSRKEADRYRKRGLAPRSKKLLRRLESSVPIQSRSALEIGMGAGALTIEMLRRGARAVTGVDAVPAQVAAARGLAADYNVADRAEFLLGDFADISLQVAQADVVLMDRVICCYPDWFHFLSSAADHANVAIALTYPRDTWWFRIVNRAMDVWWMLQRSDFRFHIHPIPQMHGLLKSKGFRLQQVTTFFWWEILIATRD